MDNGSIASTVGKGASRVRIGLLVDDEKVQEWQRQVLLELAADGRFEIVLVVQNGSRQPLLRRALSSWKRLPWGIANAVEAKLSRMVFRGQASRMFDRQPLRQFLAGAGYSPQWLSVEPSLSRSGFVHRIADGDVKRISAVNCDVLLRFGFRILRGEILTSAKQGIWSFHHGDNDWNRGGPPAFWEFYRRVPVTGAVLQRLTDDLDNGVLLRKGIYRTKLLSWNQNKRHLYMRSRWLLVDALKELARTGMVSELSSIDTLGISDHRILTAPNIAQCAAAALKQAGRFLTRVGEALFARDCWELVVVRPQRQGETRPQPLRQATHVRPKGRKSFWADPFMVRRDGMLHLFFEEWPYALGRGVISHYAIPEDQKWPRTLSAGPAKVIMDNGVHLSYPFLFEHDGELYMVPESAQAKGVDVFRCASFPHGWEKVATIMQNVSCADSTFFEHDGKWWMFTNVDRDLGQGDHCSELFAYWSDTPLSPVWNSHAQNPILVDARRARMAGGVIRRKDGTLVRCAQHSGERYGERVVLCEIKELTPEVYREVSGSVVDPNWRRGISRTHHLSMCGDYIVMDAAMRLNPLQSLRQQLRI
jgi:hypothetical protein